MSTPEARPARDPFAAKPLTAAEYIDLLEGRPSLVLRMSDGTRDGTYRFWAEDGQLYWRCLRWFSAKPAEESDLDVVLDGDSTTQLLIERDGGGSE